LLRVSSKKITREHIEAFIASQATNELVLDLGCGNSPYSRYFPNRVALDIVKIEGADIIGDAHSLPFKSATFSMVLAIELLEHVKEPQHVIDEIERVLKPGGKPVLTTRFIFPLHDTPSDFYRFTKYRLRYLFRNWSKIQILCEADSFESIGILLQRIAFQSNFWGSKIVKLLLLLAARVMKIGGVLVRAQYGDIARRIKEDQILVSGYYVIAVKEGEEVKRGCE
jgi:SAM-dependent methyltransferase